MKLMINGVDLKKIIHICGPFVCKGAFAGIWLHVYEDNGFKVIARASEGHSYAEITVPCLSDTSDGDHDAWISPDLGLKRAGLKLSDIKNERTYTFTHTSQYKETTLKIDDQIIIYQDYHPIIYETDRKESNLTIWVNSKYLSDAVKAASSSPESILQIDFDDYLSPFKIHELNRGDEKVYICPVKPSDTRKGTL